MYAWWGGAAEANISLDPEIATQTVFPGSSSSIPLLVVRSIRLRAALAAISILAFSNNALLTPVLDPPPGLEYTSQGSSRTLPGSLLARRNPKIVSKGNNESILTAIPSVSVTIVILFDTE